MATTVGMDNQILAMTRVDSSLAGNFLIRVISVLLREHAWFVLLLAHLRFMSTALGFNCVELTAEPCSFTVNEWKRYASPLQLFGP
jgi:hypothetical protein